MEDTQTDQARVNRAENRAEASRAFDMAKQNLVDAAEEDRNLGPYIRHYLEARGDQISSERAYKLHANTVDLASVLEVLKTQQEHFAKVWKEYCLGNFRSAAEYFSSMSQALEALEEGSPNDKLRPQINAYRKAASHLLSQEKSLPQAA